MFTQRIKYCRKIFLIGHLALYSLMFEYGSLHASSGRDSLSQEASSSNQSSLPNTIIRDLRVTDPILSDIQYQRGEFPSEYDELTFISSTPCYKGQEKSSSDSLSISSENILIPRTISEDGMCKVIESPKGPIEQSALVKGIELRTRIEHPQTQEWPYRIHGHMIMRFPNNIYTGTGILVGPNHVLTAGHNLFKDGQWATEVFFAPGRDQDHYPYGDCKGCVLLVHEEWFDKKSKRKDDYDFGMVILDSSIGNIIGWSGLLSLPDILLKDWPVSVTGYPGEKGVGNYYSTQMWSMSKTIIIPTDNKKACEKLFYKIETSEGQSGSGVCGDKWPEYEGLYTVGVHTGQENEDAEENRGIRISKDKFNIILKWLRTYQLKSPTFPIVNLRPVPLEPITFLDKLPGKYESLINRANADEGEALHQIGALYFKGKEDIQKNDERAFVCFCNAAKKKYAPALTALGLCYEEGRGVSSHLLKAISLYDQAAIKKNAEASRRLGLLFLYGKGLPKNAQHAIKSFEEAMSKGDGEACYQLARIYEEGVYVTQDKNKATQLYQHAKKLGYNPVLTKSFSLEEDKIPQADILASSTSVLYRSMTVYNQESSIIVKPQHSLPVAFLKRAIELKKLEQEFLKNSKAVPIILLSGIGGSGKTTISRTFANKASEEGTPIVWECDAQNWNTLFVSLCDLSLNLTNNDPLQTTTIKQWEKEEEREHKATLERDLKPFLQKQFKANKWLLIFDNAVNPSDLNDFLPDNLEDWGEGRVLITTQAEKLFLDRGITITIDELTPDEKLTLFSKIYRGYDPEKLSTKEKSEIQVFLEGIPPFPLDVSLAGYYLKNNSHIDYNDYLEGLKNYNDSFDETQQHILEGHVEQYKKTRYGIIKTSVDQIIKDSPKIRGILFFSALYDSYYIPLFMLEDYLEREKQKNKHLITLFSNMMGKYSLLRSVESFNREEFKTEEEYNIDKKRRKANFLEYIRSRGFQEEQEEQENLPEKYIFFSFHPSTQAIVRSYLINSQEFNENESAFILGKMYVDRTLHSLDFSEPGRYFKIAADKKHAISQTIVGTLYYVRFLLPEKGEDANERAIHYWTLSAQQGNIDAKHALYWINKNKKHPKFPIDVNLTEDPTGKSILSKRVSAQIKDGSLCGLGTEAFFDDIFEFLSQLPYINEIPIRTLYLQGPVCERREDAIYPTYAPHIHQTLLLAGLMKKAPNLESLSLAGMFTDPQLIQVLTNYFSIATHLSALSVGSFASSDDTKAFCEALEKYPLKKLKSLEFLSSYANEFPKFISKHTNLEQLRLWAGKITSIPDNIRTLKKLCYLDLSLNDIQQADISVLTHLTSLTDLDLGCAELGARNVEKLSLLTNLTSLNLDHSKVSRTSDGEDCKINSQSISFISSLLRLRDLNLNDSELRGEDIGIVSHLTNLETLKLKDTPVHLRDIPFLPNIRTLNLNKRFYTFEGKDSKQPDIGELIHLTSLTDLDLGGSALGEQDVENLTLLTNLTSLNLEVCKINSRSFSFFSPLIRLRHLFLENNELKREDISIVSHLTDLETLELQGTSIHLRDIPFLPNIRILNLSKSFTPLKSEDDEIEEESAYWPLTTLTSLNLSGYFSADPDPQEPGIISSLTSLTYLDLSHNSNCLTNITPHFSNLINLTSLDYRNSEITKELCDNLAKIPGLTKLDLGYVKSYETDKIYLDELREARPNLTLELNFPPTVRFG